MIQRILSVVFFLACTVPAVAQEKAIAPEQLEFFEKKIRPVLVEHCYECHSTKAKKVKAGLLLDSRAGILEGGDNGPAIVPGHPDKSRLIEAIRYTNVDLKMPKKGKLADAVIADLAAWVKMGSPWPDEKQIKKTSPNEFNLAKRKAEHWCWRPISAAGVPEVKDRDWARTDVDRFLLAKLEAKGLKPTPAADPRTLLRRLHFDIVGLPPSRHEVEQFVKAWDGAGAKRGEVLAQVVDRLLESPQFGERWARHWLDLVRYAESRGHEFDYTIPNAHHYRDYVIRAFNDDVPYKQFVQEHLAGDLLKTPRLHPKDGFNESILGTAFWFLGEEVHSPVDIRQDQADRFDNRIDVMTKTFLGLTVACARCHDHKFDAISTKDYYALFGILESSNYRLARFDTITHNRKVAEELARFRAESRKPIQDALAKAMAPTMAKLDAYLVTAGGIEDRSNGLDAQLLQRWKVALGQAMKNEMSPLHPFAKVVAEKNRPVQDVLAPIRKRWPMPQALAFANADIIVDHGNPRTTDLLADDVAFGLRPVRAGEMILGPNPSRPIARIVELSAAERDRAMDGLRLAAGSQNESGSLGGAQRPGRTLRTPEFTLKYGKAFAYVKGNGMIYAGVGQHIMLAGPLHGRLVQRFNTGDKFQWVAIDLMPYKGQRAHLEFTPNEGADFALAIAVQAENTPPPATGHSVVAIVADCTMGAQSIGELARLYQGVVLQVPLVLSAEKAKTKPEDDPAASFSSLTNWAVQNADLFIVPGSEAEQGIAKVAGPILEQHKKILAQIKLDSRLTPAMQDGSGTDEFVFTRGNPKTLGPQVPRRFLEAFTSVKAMPIKTGSGRLELAQQMTDPAITPLITRVYVNRVWHHLFGRGIVASVDNFGVLGESPTHPELLDHLADQFVRDGWSTKKLIRALVLTNAYPMASTPDAKTDEADPNNLLLHRMRLRRLEGEAIRDAILKVSGRLNSTMYGPSVPVYLTAFQDGRGRPGSGPLDGDGRRSVYMSVRRNFLSSFLLAFDTPSPFSTVGRRTNSNVPAQALILMNDPFVHSQADVWAKRVVAEKGTIEERVRGMYVDAFARPPSETELKACISYLGATPDLRRWADLGHVLINTKEFYFVN